MLEFNIGGRLTRAQYQYTLQDAVSARRGGGLGAVQRVQ